MAAVPALSWARQLCRLAATRITVPFVEEVEGKRGTGPVCGGVRGGWAAPRRTKAKARRCRARLHRCPGVLGRAAHERLSHSSCSVQPRSAPGLLPGGAVRSGSARACDGRPQGRGREKRDAPALPVCRASG
jgi:hypothetical protein